jgi:hypothetical protein
MQAARPFDEQERVAALMSLCAVGAPSEPRFDCITRLMRATYGTPVSLITLVAGEVLHVRSCAGEWAPQAPRSGSFCEWLLTDARAPRMLVVEDALADARFSSNRFVVGPPGIRFYAGCPLVASSGHVLGALCVLDFKPRSFTSEQYMLLAHFAELATRELERDKVRGGGLGAGGEVHPTSSSPRSPAPARRGQPLAPFSSAALFSACAAVHRLPPLPCRPMRRRTPGCTPSWPTPQPAAAAPWPRWPRWRRR